MPNSVDLRKKSVLIIECDTEKLVEESLSIGRDVFTFLKIPFFNNPIELVETTRANDLLDKFRELSAAKRKFDNVIVIGHSNENGLQMTSDTFVNWSGVAKWLSYLYPKRLFFMACRAGRLLPRIEVFDGISTLEEIYASPIPIGKQQIPFIVGIVWHVLGAKKVDGKLVNIGQLANLIFTKKLMWRYTREGIEKQDLIANLVQCAIEPLLEEITAMVINGDTYNNHKLTCNI